MVETDQQREDFILGVLKRLARQRVAVLLQPGDVWVIENALKKEKDVAEALRTCHMRGWVEPLADAVPSGNLSPDGSLLSGPQFTTSEPIYRLTDSGWNAINRTHRWDVFACLVAVASLTVSVVALLITLRK